MNNVFDEIRRAFNSLWEVRLLGDTLEIITPMSTTNDCFVSVFLTKRNGYFIVTDGGWISDDYYNNDFCNDDESFNRLFTYYITQYSIKSTEANGKTYYYKATDEFKLVPNIVYDISTFVSAVVSASFVKFQDEKDKDLQKRFNTLANDYISSILNRNELRINNIVDERLSSIKFNAVVSRRNKFTLINYVTGANESYFIGSIGRSNMNFQLINRSFMNKNIDKRITIINNQAGGYKIEKVRQYIDLIKEQTQSEAINWSEKDKIKELVM